MPLFRQVLSNNSLPRAKSVLLVNKGTVTLTMWLWSRLVWAQPLSDLLFQPLNKLPVTCRPPGSRVFPYTVQQLRGTLFRQIMTPVRHSLAHRRDSYETVGCVAKMCMNTRPAPILSNRAQASAYGIKLNVTNSREQVSVIHNHRMKALLPQMPTPIMSQIDSMRIAMMSNSK